MSTLATLVVKLVGDVSEFRSSMDGAGEVVRNAGRNMSAAGGDLTRNVTLPIIGIGAATTLMANEFNGGMANVISLVPAAAGEIAGLSDDVQQLAVDMGQSTGDMTTGLYQVVSAFGYSGDSMAQLGINAMAAKAGLASTEEAIALTSAVTKGYGDTTATATQQVADLALRTVQLGQTTFPELAASIGRVTPLAASLGATQEELFAVMATGTGVTGGAAEVSTQLRGILQSLMAPTAEMTGLYKSLGYESAQAMLQNVGLGRTIELITKTAESSGTPLQKYIGSIEGQTLAMSLGGPQMDDYTSKLAEMQNAAGTAQLAFDLQTKGVNALGFEMAQAKIQVQVMGQQIGQALQPAILSLMPYVRQFFGFIRNLVEQFTNLDPKTRMIIFGVLGLAAAIGPLLMVLGPIVTGFGAVMGVVAALVSPIGLAVAALAALGVGFVALKNVDASEFLANIWNSMATWWDTQGSTWVRTTSAKIVAWVRNIPSVLLGMAINAGSWLVYIWNSLYTWWDKGGSAWVTTVVDKIAGYVRGIPTALGALAIDTKSWLAYIWNGLHGWWENEGSGWVTTAVGKIASFVKGIPGALVSLAIDAKSWLVYIWNGLHGWWDTTGSGWVTAAVDKIASWIKTIPAALTALSIDAKAWLDYIWNGMATWWDTNGAVWVSAVGAKIGVALGQLKAWIDTNTPQWAKDAVMWLDDVWMGTAAWWTDYAQPLTTEMVAGFTRWMTGQLVPALQNADKSTWASGIAKVLSDGFSQAIDYLYSGDTAAQFSYAIAKFFSSSVFNSISIVGEMMIGIPALLIKKLLGQDIDIGPGAEMLRRVLGSIVTAAVDGFTESAIGGLISSFFTKFVRAIEMLFMGTGGGGGGKTSGLSSIAETGGISLVTGFVSGLGGLITSVTTKWGELTTWFGGLPAEMTQLGRDLIQGAIDGIAERAQDMKDFIETLFGDVIAIAKRILGIKSPSSIFADIGGNLALGFAAGIRASTPAAVDAVNAMMSQVGRARPAPMALAMGAAGGYGGAGQRSGQSGSQAGGGTWNVTINVQGGAGDARAVGRAAEDGMLRALRQVGRR